MAHHRPGPSDPRRRDHQRGVRGVLDLPHGALPGSRQHARQRRWPARRRGRGRADRPAVAVHGRVRVRRAGSAGGRASTPPPAGRGLRDGRAPASRPGDGSRGDGGRGRGRPGRRCARSLRRGGRAPRPSRRDRPGRHHHLPRRASRGDLRPGPARQRRVLRASRGPRRVPAVPCRPPGQRRASGRRHHRPHRRPLQQALRPVAPLPGGLPGAAPDRRAAWSAGGGRTGARSAPAHRPGRAAHLGGRGALPDGSGFVPGGGWTVGGSAMV